MASGKCRHCGLEGIDPGQKVCPKCGGAVLKPGIIKTCAAVGTTIGFALAVIAILFGGGPRVPLMVAGVAAGAVAGAAVGLIARLFRIR
jgi:hypothetical protein